MLPESIELNPTNYICVSSQHTIKIRKTLKFKQSARRGVGVFKGIRDDGLEVVVKWHLSKRGNTITDEENAYLVIAKNGCETIRVHQGYTLRCKSDPSINIKVLVLDYLKQLPSKVDVRRLAYDILHQLQFIHPYCIHSGIKPDNMLRAPPNSKYKYLLIDMGSISSQPHKRGGYIRTSWSPKWTCQERSVDNQQTLPIHDLIELGTTLKSLCISTQDRKIVRRYIKLVNKGKGVADLLPLI